MIRFFQTPAALRGMLVFMAIALAAMFFVRMKLMTHHTLNMGGVDQNVIHGTLRILHGEPLYGDPEKPPFPAIQYSPAFFYVHALVCIVAGIGPEDVQGLYVSGRAISLIFNLVSCWLIMLVCRRLALDISLSFAAAAFFFVSLTDMYFLRPDSLYAMFFWCHVAVVVSGAKDGRLNWNGHIILWSSLFAVLAVFSKQTGLIVPAMTGFVMLFFGQWKALLRFSLACGGWTALFLAALFIGNTPEASYQNVVLANVNGTDLGHMLVHLTNKYGSPITIWMALGALVALVVLRRREPQIRVYFAWAILITIAWALVTALKRGSNTNYYTESQMLAVVLCMVVLMDENWSRWRSVMLGAVIVFLPFTALLRSAMFFNATMITKFRADEPSRYFSERELSRKVREHGLASDEYVFVLTRGFSEMFLSPHTLWNAKCIVLVSDEVLAFDLSEFHRTAGDGRMKYVIAPSDRTKLEFYGMEFKEYVPLFELDGRTVHIHKKAIGTEMNRSYRSHE